MRSLVAFIVVLSAVVFFSPGLPAHESELKERPVLQKPEPKKKNPLEKFFDWFNPETTPVPVEPPSRLIPRTQITIPDPKSLPFFDVHVHYNEAAWSVINPEQVMQLFDEAGIRHAMVSSTPNVGTLRLYMLSPQRIAPELRPYRTESDRGRWFRDPEVLRFLEQNMTLGIYKGIGEFHVFGDETETPVMRAVVELAVQYNVFLHAHTDAQGARNLARMNPKAKVLLAHAAFSDPATVNEIMCQYPNVWTEVAIRGDITDYDGALKPEWRDLFLHHSDRIMLGSDTFTNYRWTDYKRIMGHLRYAMLQLPPDVAENIAYKTAEGLYR